MTLSIRSNLEARGNTEKISTTEEMYRRLEHLLAPATNEGQIMYETKCTIRVLYRASCNILKKERLAYGH
jgi:hypothetical protein